MKIRIFYFGYNFVLIYFCFLKDKTKENVQLRMLKSKARNMYYSISYNVAYLKT